MNTEPAAPAKRRRSSIARAAYLLILPSMIYLAVFFVWPMIRAVALAVWDEKALLTLHEEPAADSASSGALPQGTQVAVLDRAGNLASPEDAGQSNAIAETWFRVRSDEQAVEGWAPGSRIRVRESDDEGRPVAGTVRPRLGSAASTQTPLHAEPSDRSEVVAQLDGGAAVRILEQGLVEVWFLVEGQASEDETATGWARSRYLQVYGGGDQGRVAEGDTGQFTTAYIEKMVNDRFFKPALTTTFLLMLLIIPVQFILAIIMALVIQSRIRFNTLFLAIFAIPLAASDLAVGIVWYSIFTQFGYLNSILQTLGLITLPQPYLSADTRYWIIIAIWLAEVWRATAIVMVIVVSGLQAISDEVLEAAEVFGANLWQRLWHVILPLLKPSLQVALILRTILALQVFAVVIALSGGDVVTVLANETYRQYYDFRNMNVAAAYAALILLISMVSAVTYLRIVRTQEEARA